MSTEHCHYCMQCGLIEECSCVDETAQRLCNDCKKKRLELLGEICGSSRTPALRLIAWWGVCGGKNLDKAAVQKLCAARGFVVLEYGSRLAIAACMAYRDTTSTDEVQPISPPSAKPSREQREQLRLLLTELGWNGSKRCELHFIAIPSTASTLSKA